MRRFLKISGTGALIVSLLLSAIWPNLAILVGHLRHGNHLPPRGDHPLVKRKEA
jgi:hypothetical protein